MPESAILTLIQNIAMLLTLALLFDALVLNPARYHGIEPSTWGGKITAMQIVIGLILGCVGIVLMLTPWKFSQGLIFDARSILLCISGLFFGPIPALVAGLITAAFRIALGGGSGVLMGILVITESALVGVLWRFFIRKPIAQITAWELYGLGLLVHVLMLACTFVLPIDTALNVLKMITLPVITIYPLGTLLLGLVIVNRLKREQNTADLHRNEILQRSLIRILQNRVDSTQEFLDFALSEGIHLTGSKIGYIYFYSEERREFVLNSWSREVMAECRVMNPQTCYELDKTGIWGEAVRQGKPIILNNYQSRNPLKKGTPPGHIRLEKFMTIPLFDAGRIVAVVGMANKETDYTELDCTQLSLLMDSVWKECSHRRVRNELWDSEIRNTAIINNLPNGFLLILNSDLRILVASGDDLTSIGASKESLVGNVITAYFDTQDAVRAVEIFNLVLQGQTKKFEETFSGQTFLVNAAPLRAAENGDVHQILILAVNISERKQSEAEKEAALRQLEATQADLRMLNIELERRVSQRTEQLENLNKELEAFSYSVSHDLRAPLRVLEGFSELLRSDYEQCLDQQAQGYIFRIQNAVKRMNHLIDDLLNLSRISRQAVKREIIDLSQLSAEIAAEISAQDPERDVRFDIRPGIKILADPRLIRIVMTNLLDNAYKFTMNRLPASIQVGMDSRDGTPIYYVRDNGAGFDMQFSQKLFAPFQRLHSEKEFPGTGIGLVTIQRIINRHGGEIWPEAQPDRGATFYFSVGGQE
jgi:signal transduction histidine kinase